MTTRVCCMLAVAVGLLTLPLAAQQVIRINQLGYPPQGIKVAVWGSKSADIIESFELVDSATGRAVFGGPAGRTYGAYGPFAQSYRLHFTAHTQPGTYFLRAGKARSPYFRIDHDVYRGTADFCLRYMRQQRSGFNPFLRDSCHQYDGYTLYAPLPDSTYLDAAGGWHDASDYLQYVTTSANATYQLLAAWRDFPRVFNDAHLANGLPGRNGLPDIADEARWGLDWLIKMHPTPDLMFHQIADDRDHISMRRPALDSQYGRGAQRPVYFVTGQPQGSERHKNRSNGVANIAGKFSSAFGLGFQQFVTLDGAYAARLRERALNAYQWGIGKPGVQQTAPNRAPYFYEEENWADDMQLAASQLYGITRQPRYLQEARRFSDIEPVTPWMGADTMRHYQWYPFANAGHYEMAMLNGGEAAHYRQLMKEGIEKVWAKGKDNAFLRGVPFVWCSNNLTVGLANQIHWYRSVTGDSSYNELLQAQVDWLLGCNPWGTSMIYGLPAHGDTPTDPHSWFTRSNGSPIDGGLVDGPLYTATYKSMIGLQLTRPDAYADWQSDLAVYHDDYGDYSTNEPTMDGTASLIYLLAAQENDALRFRPTGPQMQHGAIIRGDSADKRIALVFTGHDYADGASAITQILAREKVKASFFLTGEFLRRQAATVKGWRAAGHYIGPHSEEHLLYADWNKRDSLYVTRAEFEQDLLANYRSLQSVGVSQEQAPLFLPPYEWYNDSIAAWTRALGLTLINHTPGTLSAADYTTPDMPNYRSSDTIHQSILARARTMPYGLNGYFLLMHVGTAPERTDKYYLILPLLIQELRSMGYRFVRADEMLGLYKPPPPRAPVRKPAAKPAAAKKPATGAKATPKRKN